MPIYAFHPHPSQGAAHSPKMVDAPNDSAAFAEAADLLEQYDGCDYVDVFEGDRPVVSRHRYQPIIRPVETGGAETGLVRARSR